MKINLLSGFCFNLLKFPLLILLGCSDVEPLFNLLPSDQTGITFLNRISNDDSINVLNYIYYYNGGGVGAGDFNNDGLIDLFFSGNKSDDELYFNQGNWSFKNVTLECGIKKQGWSTGVNVIDINQDGWLDIYVCRAGVFKDSHLRKNVLYVNQKNGTFLERANEFGIADTSNSTHSIFFDYDRDGDLDLYVMNHGNDRKRVNTPVTLLNDGTDESVDHLYCNKNGQFENVSIKSGIIHEGYGLGLAIHDINADGWPDIFVSNDFIFSDLVYINNTDGTFSEKSKELFGHQSYSSMGCDLGDINNDGLLDLMILDMLPWSNERQKTMMGAMNYDKYHTIISNGYAHQYMRNILQLNLGMSHYSDIGRFAGIQATDWSWTPLFADFDNDGLTDIFISNGYYKNITDKDYLNYSNNLSMFKSAELSDSAILSSLEYLNEVQLPNIAFKNMGNLKYSDVSATWIAPKSTLSNGAIYADLDNDGDLDLITNNLNSPAGIYKNQLKEDAGHYLNLKLKSNSDNRNSVGSIIRLFAGPHILTRIWQPSRGYQGSSHGPIHFGIHQNQRIDSLDIYWPDGTYSRYFDLPLDTTISIVQPNQLKLVIPKDEFVFNLTLPGLEFHHREDHFVDFHIQPLIPKKLSHEGPALAIGDLNHDGLDDIFIGGASGQASKIYYQNLEAFTPITLPDDSLYEDTDAVIADFNGDGRNDLLVARGGYVNLGPALYLSGEEGKLIKATSWIPELEICSSTIAEQDVDQDGDIDIFIGGRFTPSRYPESPNSTLLINTGFSFQEASGWPRKLGMITDAKWMDVDQDDSQDLIIAGEWMAVSILKNNNGSFEEVETISNLRGFWQSIYVTDIDKDGDPDIIAGNYGTNNDFNVSIETPLELIAADFDNNGTIDPIITKQYPDGRYPIAPRDDLIRQLPHIYKRVLKYHTYARTSVDQLLTKTELSKADRYNINELRSGIFINQNGKFVFEPFPSMAQLSPIRAIEQYPCSNGLPGLILAGNDYHIEILEGRQDALPALKLEQTNPLKFHVSTFFNTEDVRHIASLKFAVKNYWVLAQNDNNLLILEQ